MQAADFIQAVRERLHPNTYPGLLQSRGSPFDLILARNRGRLAHDVFGVLTLPAGGNPRALIEAARADVAARFGALCFRRALVLHLLVHGPAAAWKDSIETLCADRTGFRGVMVQSIYVVDTETCTSHKSLSRWGSLCYSPSVKAAAQQVEGMVAAVFGA